MARTCIFCGETPVTREHLWPDWLRRLVDVPVPFRHHLEQEVDGVEVRDERFEAIPYDQTVRVVCAGCNNGWMSRAESDAKPILEPLLEFRGRQLHRREQRILASWALLRACCFDGIHPGHRAVFSRHREHLFEHGEP